MLLMLLEDSLQNAIKSISQCPFAITCLSFQFEFASRPRRLSIHVGIEAVRMTDVDQVSAPSCDGCHSLHGSQEARSWPDQCIFNFY